MLVQRMIRAARLDPDVYYEVERDQNANGQAFLVILIVVACALIPALLSGLFLSLIPWFVQLAICQVGGWLFWSAIAAAVGARIGSRGSFDGVMRAVGFAHSPGVLWLFASVPVVGAYLIWIAWIWTTIAEVLALRESMALNLKKAALTWVIATAIVVAINFVLGLPMSTLGYVMPPR